MNKQEQELVQQIKKLFYHCKLNDCVNLIDQLDHDRSLQCHKILQLYKGISLFEMQQQKEGEECLESIILENKKQNGDKIDEIDIIIRVMYQLEVYYISAQKAESLNHNLFNNSKSDGFSKGIYLFGQGMYYFIENSREQKDIEKIKLIEEASELVKQYKQEILICLGWIYYIYSKIDLSCKWNQALYKINPRYPSLANNYAISLHQKGKNGQAEELFLQEEKLRGQNQFYYSVENIGKEKEYYNKLFALNPKTAKVYLKYGQYLMRVGQRDRGIALLHQGLEVDPSYCPIYQQLSDIEYDSTNYQKATEYIQKCIIQFPKDGYYMYRYAVCLERLGKSEGALEAYKKAITLKNYLAYKIYSNFRLGLLYYELGQYLRSFEEFLNSCDYKGVQTCQLKGNILSACNIINNDQPGISLRDKIELINNKYGYIVTRFDQFKKSIADQNFKQLIQYKLDSYRTVLAILTYQKYIESQLIYQSQILHWDLYVN